MRRFSQKTIVLTTALLLVIGAALFLIVKPDLPGRWRRDGEEWFICLREWQTLIAGLLALVSASWTVYYIRQDIAQSAKIADREHALATASPMRPFSTRSANSSTLSTPLEVCIQPALALNPW